ILLALLALTLDRQRLRWRHVALAAAPFVLLSGLWFLYVLQAPDVAASQFAAQSKIPHRFVFLLNPWRQFGGEIATRYAWAYHFNASSPSIIVRGVILVFYFAAVPALLCFRSIRRRPGAKLIASFTLISFALLSCFQDNAYYLVYVLPGFSAALAICIVALLEIPSWWSRAVVAATAAAVLLNLLPILSRIKHNTYRN